MNDTIADAFKLSVVDGLANQTLTSCSRWAAHRRVMGGDFAGNYSDKHHPWVREMHNSWAPFNYAMKGAQLGVTEVCINRALYTLDMLKRDVLYVLPTTKTATDFSKVRFGGALALSPYLRSLFSDINSVGLKQAGSNALYIRGSRGTDSLVSIPVSELILDEVDRMKQSQLWLALERLSGQLTKHVWGISTPTVPEYGIHSLYARSTQEHYLFPCPSCNRAIELKWPESVVVVGEHTTDARCSESYLKCYECNARLEHADKPNFLAKAYWESFDRNANPEVRGFHINQLYSFTVTPGELVVAHFRGFGDELAAKEFRNSKLGLPHIGDGARVTDDMLSEALKFERYSKQDPRPDRAGRIITMGLDRGTWNHFEICEWFFNDWTLDINADAFAKVLYEGKFHEEDFDRSVDQLMREWQVLACVVDADPGPMDARRFARRFPGYVWLCRYRRGQTAKEISISDEEDGAPIATVDRSNWLSASLSRFKTKPSRIMLPVDVSEEYQNHMKALVATYNRDEFGNPVLEYVTTGSGADHFAHARTYAEIALPLVAARTMNVDLQKFR